MLTSSTLRVFYVAFIMALMTDLSLIVVLPD
jgi:hypothetical protein